MVNQQNEFSSNIWGNKKISLPDSQIINFFINLDEGIINLETINKSGKIRDLIIDPIKIEIINSEYIIPEFSDSNINIISSMINIDGKFLINNKEEKIVELWAKPNNDNYKQSNWSQNLSNEKPNFIIDKGKIFIHEINNDSNKSFLDFFENSLPKGMEFNLDNISLEWVPDSMQFGFHEISYFLEMREIGKREMSIEEDLKHVNQ